jgi:hypothetical protein
LRLLLPEGQKEMTQLMYAVCLPATKLVHCMAISLGLLSENSDLTIKECHIIQDKIAGTKVSDLVKFDSPTEWIVQEKIVDALLDMLRNRGGLNAIQIEYVPVHNLLGLNIKPSLGILWTEKGLSDIKTTVEVFLRTVIKCPLDNYGLYIFSK